MSVEYVLAQRTFTLAGPTTDRTAYCEVKPLRRVDSTDASFCRSREHTYSIHILEPARQLDVFPFTRKATSSSLRFRREGCGPSLIDDTKVPSKSAA